jgi:hypothetical protein
MNTRGGTLLAGMGWVLGPGVAAGSAAALPFAAFPGAPAGPATARRACCRVADDGEIIGMETNQPFLLDRQR